MFALYVLYSELSFALRAFIISVRSAVAESFVSKAEPARYRLKHRLKLAVFDASLINISGKRPEYNQRNQSRRNKAQYKPCRKIKHKSVNNGNKHRKNKQGYIKLVAAVTPLHKGGNSVHKISHNITIAIVSFNLWIYNIQFYDLVNISVISSRCIVRIPNLSADSSILNSLLYRL